MSILNRIIRYLLIFLLGVAVGMVIILSTVDTYKIDKLKIKNKQKDSNGTIENVIDFFKPDKDKEKEEK